MSRRRRFRERSFGALQWMGGGWWAALGLSVVMIVALRSGTVGAPSPRSLPSADARAEASERLVAQSADNAALELNLRKASRELELTRAALQAEKERVALLQENYDGLDDQFSHVTDLVRASAVPASFSRAKTEVVPAPVEAIYVRSETPKAKASESQQ